MGGTWLIGIVALFIVLFSGFIAYSINYTKAFNTKNQILNLIEKNEGFSQSTKNAQIMGVSENKLREDNSTEAQAYLYILQSGYNTDDVDCKSLGLGVSMPGGYCVQRFCNDKNSQNNNSLNLQSRVYYKITTFIKIEIPIINIGFNLPISGETKSMYYDSGNLDCFEVSTGK